MTLTARLSERILVAAAALACVLGGYAAAQRESLGLLVLAGLAGLALVVVFQELGFATLVGWVALTGLAYPFLSHGATGTPVGFDRVVVAGMASWLAVPPPGGGAAAARGRPRA